MLILVLLKGTMPVFKNIKTKYALFIVFGLLISMQSCNKETKLGKFYHNVTARFNGYFNAKSKYEESLYNIEESFEDDYNEILPIFVDANDQQFSAQAANMEIVIKKCTNVIQKHTVSKWVDDCYLLIGKAYYQRHEYFEGLEAFNYIADHFKTGKIRYESQLWAAKAYMATDQDFLARQTLDLAFASKGRFPEDLKDELYLTEAQYHIKQKEYKEAIKSLATALNLIKKKKDAARYHFILGQLYLIDEKERKASSEFEVVLKSNPGYDMFFNAQMKRAMLADARSDKGADIKKSLTKMLKDDKNKDYLGQIYYELGNIALREQKEDEALLLLSKAAWNAGSNKLIKGQAYNKVADLYFEKQSYVKAQQYYDSTSRVIDKEYERYDEVIAKRDHLQDLVKYITIIQRQDSLLQYQDWPDRKLLVFVTETVRKELEEEKRNAELAKEEETRFAFEDQGGSGSGDQQEGNLQKFYFYNQGLVASGIGEFRQNWGDRPREDNWRRKNKNQNVFAGDEKGKGAGADSSFLESEDDRIKRYLANVPRTDSAISVVEGIIANALFELARLYKDKLNDPNSAIAMFERQISEFPGSNNEVIALYNLHLLLAEDGDEEGSKKYAGRVLTEYPNTTYALLIKDPGALAKAKKNEQKADLLYTEAFNAFSRKSFSNALVLADSGLTAYPNNNLEAKYLLLKAICIGKVSGKENMIIALNDVIKNFSGSKEAKRAQEILDSFKEPEQILEEEEEISLFNLESEEIHYYIILVKAEEKGTRKVRVKVNDYNRKHYSLLNLKVINYMLGLDREMIVVKDIENKATALKYFKKSELNVTRFEGLKEGSYLHFVISQTNFNIFYKDKLIDEYQEFFNRKYLGKSDKKK